MEQAVDDSRQYHQHTNYFQLFNPNHILLFFYKVCALKYSNLLPHSFVFHDDGRAPYVSFLFPLHPMTVSLLPQIPPCPEYHATTGCTDLAAEIMVGVAGTTVATEFRRGS